MNEIISNSENQLEGFKEVDLEIKAPDGIHGLEITFEENDSKLIRVYNLAINEVGNVQNKLGLFKQTGRGNESGHHAWEVLGSEDNVEKLKGLLPLIHHNAKETYKKYDEMNLF